MLERLAHQLEPELERRAAGAVQLFDHPRVVRGIDDDEDVAEVLGGRPDEAGTADVDLLDEVVERRIGIGGGLGEGVEIDDHQVDRANALGGNRREVVGAVAAGQDAGVDRRMEGLDPAVHHLRKAGDVGDAGHS